jgi:hypothetical protein
MRDTAALRVWVRCLSATSDHLERRARGPGPHFVNLEFSQGAPSANYQNTNPQFARMISLPSFVNPRERARDGDTIKLATSGAESVHEASPAGGTARIVVVRQPCPGEHSQP